MILAISMLLAAAPTIQVVVKDTNGSPVANAEVRVAGDAAFVSTSAQGIATLPARPPVTILVSHPDFLNSTEDLLSTSAAVRLGRAPVLVGVVRDDAGAFASGVEVAFGGGHATTDERGAFRVVSLLEGSQAVNCRGANSDLLCKEVRLEAKSGAELHLELTAHRLDATLTITITNAKHPEVGFRRGGAWLPHLTIEEKPGVLTSRVPVGELELVVLEDGKPRLTKPLKLSRGDKRMEHVKLTK
ncbi:MAG: carboxypeptidase-like regulatory domain-containing protein [Archangium sp.]|nr:carboxypeptidase-like regulatory domain-containing protein [Archangium sp.]